MDYGWLLYVIVFVLSNNYGLGPYKVAMVLAYKSWHRARSTYAVMCLSFFGARLCAPSTKIVSVMVSQEDYHLNDSKELDENSEDVQADIQALRCGLVAVGHPLPPKISFEDLFKKPTVISIDLFQMNYQGYFINPCLSSSVYTKK